MEKFDIIILGLARWDGEYSSTTLSLAKELAKTHRVFYIDNPFTLNAVVKDFKKTQVKRRLKALFFGKDFIQKPFPELENFHSVTPKWVLPINWINKPQRYDSFNRINRARVLSSVRKLIDKMAISKAVFMNVYNPFYLPSLKELPQIALSIYYTVDTMSASPYIAKHGVRLEQEALKQSDFGLATSKKLQQDSKQYKQVHYLPNAANIELFSTAASYEKPKEYKDLEGEIIVYTGNLMVREDYPMLKKLAEQYPERHLLLVGPINTNEHVKIGLDKLPNVHFTGGKALEELPGYLAHAHCAIIPFIPNELTAGIYPLKINEYLATGIPVVSTKFSEDIKGFKPVCYLAENHEEFIEMVDKAIKGNSEEKAQARKDFAKDNNWTNRAKQLLQLISENLPN